MMKIIKQYYVQILPAISLLLFINILYPIKLTIFLIGFIILLYAKVKRNYSFFIITRNTNKYWKREMVTMILADSFLCGIILTIERVLDYSNYSNQINFILLFVILFFFLSICSMLLIFPFLDIIKSIFLIVSVMSLSLTRLDIFYYFNLLVEPSYWQYDKLLNGIIIYAIVLIILILSFWNIPMLLKTKEQI